MDYKEVLKTVFEEIANKYGEGEEWRRTIDWKYWQSFRAKRLRNEIGTIGLIETKDAISFVIWSSAPVIEEGMEYMIERFRIKASSCGWRASEDIIRAHFGFMGVSVFHPIARIIGISLMKAEKLAQVKIP